MQGAVNKNLDLSEWSLPDGVLLHYQKRGISQMFPWQLECLSLGQVLEGENLVYSAPTSAGKTLVAEILVAQTVFHKQKKALVILPFVSVVREKMFYFQEMLSSSGIRVEGFMGGHTPSASFNQVQVAVCTIEKANALVNRMMEEKTLENVGVVVVDELHLLGDPYRGYLLELLLTKLKYMSSQGQQSPLQIIGMSATLPNLKILANWLNAQLFYTDFRPIPLSERLKCGRALFNSKLVKVGELEISSVEAGDDSENVGHLCIETMASGHSVLIFCPTKVWCENLAVKLASYFRKMGCSASALEEGTPGWTLRKQLNLSKVNQVVEHLRISPVGLDKELGKTVPYGVAFHHAGLTLDERDIVEGSFRNGSLRVLCATSTLSSGVNLPARRVIIRSPMSFGGVMDVLTYRQMIGRAGRMGVDTEGESILICKPSEKQVCQQLMSANLKPIESCLGSGRLSASLKRAILEVVAGGVANTPDQVNAYASATFLAASTRGSMEDPLTSCLDFLKDNELVRLVDGEKYVPTPLGQACLASSLPPDEGLALFKELERARRCFVLDSDLHIIYQVTPYSVSEQWSKIDWLRVLNMLEELPPSMRRVADMVGVEDAFLIKVVKETVKLAQVEERSKLSIHRRFYTALALQELVNEVPLPDVAVKFDCNKGMLQSLQQSAATYAGMVAEFCRRLRWETMELIVSQFQERLQFGVQRELCELMRLPSLNGVRARTLFNAGLTTLSSVANAEISEVEEALLSASPFQSKGQIAGEADYEHEQRTRAQAVWVTGRAGLTPKDAAEILVKEARDLLELELGVGAKWGVKDSMLSQTSKSCRPEQVTKADAVSVENSQQLDDYLKLTTTCRPPTVVLYKTEQEIASGLQVEKNICCEKTENVEQILGKNDIIVNSSIDQRNGCEIECVNKQESTRLKSDKLENRTALENDIFGETVNAELLAVNLEVCTPQVKKATNGFHQGALSPNESFGYTLRAELLRTHLEQSVERARCGEKRKRRSTGSNDGSHSDNDLFGGSFDAEILQANFEEHNGSCPKLKKSRFSTDLFDASPKPFSTPASDRVTPLIFNSPDLFSQSLTFDTQLQQICDSEEMVPGEQDSPHSPIKSDDMGFFSESSPAFVNEIDALVPCAMETVGESFFVKKIANRSTSPDTIAGSDESICDGPTRRAFAFRKRLQKTKNSRKDIMVVTLDASDEDEIAPTPRPLRLPLSRCLRSNTQLSTAHSNADSAFSLSNCDDMEGCKFKVLPSWNSLNIIDVCGNVNIFKTFCEELLDQRCYSLALGCRKKALEKSKSIGAQILNKSAQISTNDLFEFENLILGGIAFYWRGDDIFYMDMENCAISREERLQLLKDLSKVNRTIVLYDVREQLRTLMFCTGVSIKASFHDPKVAAWLISEGNEEPSLLPLLNEFQPEAVSLTKMLGHVPGGGSPGMLVSSPLPAKSRASYECLLVAHLMTNMSGPIKEKNMFKAFNDIEMPLLPILASMEVAGMQFNKDQLMSTKEYLEEQIKKLEQKAHQLAGRKFAISSYAAIKKVLYTELRLGKNMPKNKQPSTSKDALEALNYDTGHPLPLVILQWRKVKAVIVKVLFPLLQMLPNIRVHGSCQTFTVTGRISMREPNLQNVPRDFNLDSDTEQKISLRHIFVAKEGYDLLSADYCQVELRILAHLSGDAALLQAITGNDDVFSSIASSIYNVPIHQVTDQQRQRAKQTCYGIIYGVGVKTLSVQLRSDETAAQKLVDDFMQTYSGVKTFLVQTAANCRERGFVQTLAGRRRYLPAINSEHSAARSEAERQAVNTTVQGSAADLVKTAMVRFDLLSKEFDVQLVLHLHDEIIYEVHKSVVDTVANLLRNVMETAWPLSLPLPVKVRSGPSWGELWPHISCK